MRFLRLSLASAVTFTIFAGQPVIHADDSVSRSKEESARKTAASRHWGAEAVVPQTKRSGPRDKVLPNAVVEFNAGTEKIAVIRPIDSAKGIPVSDASDPKDAAERYLKANHQALGLSANLSELHLAKSLDMGGSVSLSYEQRHEGVPVFGGQVYVVAKNDRILLVSAELVSFSNAGKLPAPPDSAAAVKAVADDVNSRYPSPQDERFKPKARFGLLVHEQAPVLAWEIDYVTKDDGYRAYVDAATNRVLSVTSTSIDN